MTEQDIKDWLAQNQGASDTTMTQMARQNMVDPGMIARNMGVPVTDVYSRMAAVPQQRQQGSSGSLINSLPSDWNTYDPQAKINYYNQNNITPEKLASAGVSQSDIDWMRQHGYTVKGLPSYNTFLDNLMGSMGASGGMMGGNMGFDMPALATSTYVRPTFGNLNDVRTQAEAAYKAKKADEEAAKKEEIKQAIEQYVSSGGDLGMLTGGTGTWGWDSPGAASVGTTTRTGPLGALEEAAQLIVGKIANSLPGAKQDPEKVPVIDLINPSGNSWGGVGAGNGGFSYGDTSDSGYASDAGYSGGGGWSSSDNSGGWAGY